MARPDRNTTDRLDALARLAAEPYRFGFQQAVRMLECLHRTGPRIGKSLRAADDPVRFAQQATLGFAPSTISEFKPPDAEHAGRLVVRFFGLLGPQGPLPTHLTEYARDRLRNHDDPTLVRFFDVFHHRLLSLFYRAWADAQPTVHADRPGQDRFAAYVGSLAGIGSPALAGRDHVPDAARRYYAGRFAALPRNAEGLEAVLNDFFDRPVRVEQFVGHWIEIPHECRSRLGLAQAAGTLGRTAAIGRRVWDCQHKFRIVFGPVGIEDFRRLLPDGDNLPRLVDLVRSYVGDQFTWDLQLVLERAEVPRMVLGRQGRIGWTTWLAGRSPTRDAADLTLTPVAPASP